ncbi:MAG TPA: sulfurtransferase TusA family protein [Solirubrobacteraceae bacterium]|jgi:tRNA 2-thiouridine synthesizing protein A|nr:sulfurtransferase TusA family protein [Solirubrobacteraceae bacterium]
MVRTLDVRGLRCPLPLIHARAALPALGPGDVLEVLATDPEAPIDLAALAADAALEFDAVPEGAGWRITLLRSGGPGSPAG